MKRIDTEETVAVYTFFSFFKKDDVFAGYV